MRHSKYRIRQALEQFPEVRLRRIQDPLGDTGCFLITTYRDAETAHRVNRMLRAEGIVTFPQGVSNVVMTDWGCPGCTGSRFMKNMITVAMMATKLHPTIQIKSF